MLTAEQRLWRNVLVQALDDMKRFLVSKHEKERRQLRGAVEYLLKPNRDFEAVCVMADLEATRVREFARKMMDDVRASHHQQAVAGVGDNLAPGERDRRGRDAHDCAELEFSQPCP